MLWLNTEGPEESFLRQQASCRAAASTTLNCWAIFPALFLFLFFKTLSIIPIHSYLASETFLIFWHGLSYWNPGWPSGCSFCWLAYCENSVALDQVLFSNSHFELLTSKVLALGGRTSGHTWVLGTEYMRWWDWCLCIIDTPPPPQGSAFATCLTKRSQYFATQ